MLLAELLQTVLNILRCTRRSPVWNQWFESYKLNIFARFYRRALHENLFMFDAAAVKQWLRSKSCPVFSKVRQKRTDWTEWIFLLKTLNTGFFFFLWFFYCLSWQFCSVCAVRLTRSSERWWQMKKRLWAVQSHQKCFVSVWKHRSAWMSGPNNPLWLH